MLEVDQGGGNSRKTAAPEVDDVAAGVVLELLRLVLDVEEEEGAAEVLLHRSTWRRDIHGIRAVQLVPVVAFGGGKKGGKRGRSRGEGGGGRGREEEGG